MKTQDDVDLMVVMALIGRHDEEEDDDKWKKNGSKNKNDQKKPKSMRCRCSTHEKKVWLKINARNVRNGKQHTFEFNVKKRRQAPFWTWLNVDQSTANARMNSTEISVTDKRRACVFVCVCIMFLFQFIRSCADAVIKMAQKIQM